MTKSSTKVIAWATGPLSLFWNMPLGGLPAEFDAGHGEINASFLPKGMDQRGHSYFRCLPHWPLPFPSACCLTNLLQGVYSPGLGSHFNCMLLQQYSPISVSSSTFEVGSFVFDACCLADSALLVPEVTFSLFHISDGSA